MAHRFFDEKKYAPADVTIKIWRYMDVTRFISLLETSSLYFAPLSSFSDTFEGAIPQHTVNSLPKNSRKELIKSYDLMLRYVRTFTANCWHANTVESEALWKLYSNGGLCIAVQSTYETVRNQINDEIPGVQIRYLDYDVEGIEFLCDGPERMTMSFIDLAATKRKSFEHEKEIRFIIPKSGVNLRHSEIPPQYRVYGLADTLVATGLAESDPNRWFGDRMNKDFPYQPPVPSGDLIKVDLNKMIQKVYISPTVKDWEASAIEGIVRRYNFDFHIEKSKLLHHPKQAL
jgi:hypothetical protein